MRLLTWMDALAACLAPLIPLTPLTLLTLLTLLVRSSLPLPLSLLGSWLAVAVAAAVSCVPSIF
jgi:hypothetical protein